MSRDLQPIGGVQEIDADGFLVNPASVDAIEPPWDGLVDATVDVLRRNLGDDLHSVYVRGSVVQGNAIEGVSDLDCFFVTRGLPVYWWDKWGDDECDALEDRFPFCDCVELDCVPMAALWKHRRFRWIRFHMKTQAACVFGEDLAPRLDPVRLGIHAMMHAPHLQSWLNRYRRKVDGWSSEKRVDECQHIMKFLVRSGFDLVMEREQIFTRDLVRCFNAFTKHYPERTADMRQALELALEPTSDLLRTRPLVDGLGGWLAGEASEARARVRNLFP